MQALQYVEIEFDHCSLTYGIAPCTASLTSPATGTDKCFNTLQTCQDRPHFTTELFTLRFAVPTAYLPADIEAIPNVKSIAFDSATVSLGANLGQRASITVVFEDHRHSDTGGLDKYLTDRTYNPFTQGTFWGKFRARVPFLRGRNMRWIVGEVGDALADMETRHYIIDSFSGPNANGEYVIVAKDILKLADGDRALAPVPNTGYLASDITSSATSVTLLPAGAGAEYAITGYASIGGSEIVTFQHQAGYVGGSAPFAVVLTGPPWVRKSAGLTGAVDGKQWTFSCWVKRTTTSTVLANIFNLNSVLGGIGAQVRVDVRFETGGKLTFAAVSAVPAIVLNAQSATVITANRWIHILCSFDLTSTSKRHIYVSDVDDTGTYITYTNTDIDFTVADSSVGAYPDTTSQFDGEIAQLWFHTTYIDFSVEANRRKFITADLRPVDLGASGQTPTGSSPLVFLNNSTVGTWANNLGTAGNYAVVTGPLIAGTFEAGDTLALISRGQLNTIAATHSADDRVQEVLRYLATDPAEIIADLLETYAFVDAAFIPIDDWTLETTTYLNRLYSANIAVPTPVKDLVSEIIEQAGLCLWWNDLDQTIGLAVLRGVVTGAAFTEENVLAATLDISEQPDKRLSQVHTYFAQINPLTSLDDKINFKSLAIDIDTEAESDYGSAAIKEIFSRWIPIGGRTTADRLNSLLLSRYVDPPRHIKFQTLRGVIDAPTLARACTLTAWPFQDALGAADTIPFQVTRIRPLADVVEVEGDELLFEASTTDLSNRTIIFDANVNSQNARTVHDALYPAASSGDHVSIIVAAGVIVGSTSTATPALDIGTWVAGVSVSLEVLGRIQGHGGDAPAFGPPSGTNGNPGGTALYTRKAITLIVENGQVYGGGGSGATAASGGGGGAGQLPGAGGSSGFGNGNPGTTETGGTNGGGVQPGGNGGGPGLAGSGDGAGLGRTGGAAGAAIDGISFCSISSPGGDRRGGEIN